jgi:hypothetical protein
MSGYLARLPAAAAASMCHPRGQNRLTVTSSRTATPPGPGLNRILARTNNVLLDASVTLTALQVNAGGWD